MKKILVVDDEADMLAVWIEQIRLWGVPAEVHTADNGVDALATILKHKKFDLIITDFSMPGMNGLEFIQAFRKNDTDTAVFLFSAYIPEVAFLSEQIENVFFFEKPIITKKLKTQIKTILETSGPIESV
ncbi:MAG: response regulator [Bacteriovoracaceae bacterium]